MRHNALSDIFPATFSGVVYLGSIWLEGNDLTNIDSGMFIGANGIYELALSLNRISVIESGAFDSIILNNPYSYLYLWGNCLPESPCLSYPNFYSCRESDRTWNPALQKDPSSPYCTSDLMVWALTRSNIEEYCALESTSCNLTAMKITSIAAWTFADHVNLGTLQFPDNEITTIEVWAFDGAPISTLTLKWNYLTEINSGMFLWLENTLSSLWLKANKLTSIEPILFDDFSNLDALNIWWNCLEENYCTSAFSSMRKCYYDKISSNNNTTNQWLQWSDYCTMNLFRPVANALLNRRIYSDSVILNKSWAISISNWEFSLNDSPFTSTSVQANTLDTLQVRVMSSPRYQIETTALLYLGDKQYSFSVTTQKYCGNGFVDNGEYCDSGINNWKNNYCNATCDAILPCGDGVVQVESGEQCDDKNTNTGDGCNNKCQKESGYYCVWQPSSCALLGNCTLDTIWFWTGFDSITEDCIATYWNTGDGIETGTYFAKYYTFMLDKLSHIDFIVDAAPYSLSDSYVSLLSGKDFWNWLRTDILDFNDDDESWIYGYWSRITKILPAWWYTFLVTTYSPFTVWEFQYSMLEHVECGDGIVASTEGCDDWADNWKGEGYCDSKCAAPLLCGNGIVQDLDGEECDDIINSDDNWCDSKCKIDAWYSCSWQPSRCKIDNFVWATSLGGSSFDMTNWLAISSGGYIYSVGSFSNTAYLWARQLTSLGFEDVFIAKQDLNWTVIWAKNGGSDASDRANDVVVDKNWNVYTVGSFNWNASFDGLNFNARWDVKGNSDVFVSKQEPDWTFRWVKSMWGNLTDIGNSVAVNTQGDIYVVWDFIETAYFDDVPLFGQWATDVFISKLDYTWKIWRTKWYGSTYWDHVQKVIVDQTESSYMWGTFSDRISFEDFSLTSLWDDDVFVVKHDKTGKVLWARSFWWRASESLHDLTMDQYWNIYIIWAFAIDMRLGPITLFSSWSSFDVFVAKLTPEWDVVWATKAGWDLEDMWKTIEVDANWNVYIAGTFEWTGTFWNQVFMSTWEQGLWFYDWFISVLNSSGESLLLPILFDEFIMICPQQQR